MKKKFKVVLCLFALCTLLCSGIYVKADTKQDYVVGTHNFNNTEENSAKVGDRVLEPELGWRRYDDNFGDISYHGANTFINKDDDGTSKSSDLGTYNNTRSYAVSSENSNDVSIKFTFVGSKIRLFGFINFEESRYRDAKIKIDNKFEEVFSYRMDGLKIDQSVIGSRLLYEKTGLEYGKHTVEIVGNSMNSDSDKVYCIGLDAIDIDNTASIISEKDVLAESITLNKKSLDMKVEGKDTLIATVLPENAINKKVSWTSSNPNIVTVDENGNIKAVGSGFATVTATTTDGTNLSDSCTINVKANMANLIITMNNGDTKTFNVDMNVVNDFINWYDGRSEGKGSPFYKFDITETKQPQIQKTDYIIFNNISSFEVDEYKL